MSFKFHKGFLKKGALALSLIVFILWMLLGTGTSLAWFTDQDAGTKNIFHFADFNLEVSHRLPDGTYETIEGHTDLFDDEALYEPNYVQVAYMKVENKGSVPFDFRTAVNVVDYTVATNVYGQTFNLQDHLLFGLVFDETEQGMEDKVATRAQAIAASNTKLNRYYTDWAELEAGGTMYFALIVRMPKDVGNEANYRGNVIPTVELGIIVEAQQKMD